MAEADQEDLVQLLKEDRQAPSMANKMIDRDQNQDEITEWTQRDTFLSNHLQLHLQKVNKELKVLKITRIHSKQQSKLPDKMNKKE